MTDDEWVAEAIAQLLHISPTRAARLALTLRDQPLIAQLMPMKLDAAYGTADHEDH